MARGAVPYRRLLDRSASPVAGRWRSLGRREASDRRRRARRIHRGLGASPGKWRASALPPLLPPAALLPATRALVGARAAARAASAAATTLGDDPGARLRAAPRATRRGASPRLRRRPDLRSLPAPRHFRTASRSGTPRAGACAPWVCVGACGGPAAAPHGTARRCSRRRPIRLCVCRAASRLWRWPLAAADRRCARRCGIARRRRRQQPRWRRPRGDRR
mmetsp:Transcript_1079/g.3038  ORF Transcript_1079/g.3038 Transcript_1079/m.3038 type:complete len:220 (+) Transcript_1079:408-1067(+)